MSYLDDLNSIWEAVKVSFLEKFTQSIIDLWFGELKVHSYEDNVITLSTDSDLKHRIIREKFLDLIRDGFTAHLGFEPEIKILLIGSSVQETPTHEEPKKELQPKIAENGPPDGVLPPNYKFEYTFENFIVGNSNKFAHAACLAVAERPASDYNPLFIYGPSGLGKTHLMSAVVNEIKKKKSDLRVLYIKGDEFTNEMIQSLAKQEMHKFHERYRNCDILLIDDIQFIAGKTSTQEEFFHTFNTLYEERKQIILSSDRPPKDIPTLEERLKTRFEWGLLADIQPPDLELRIAIIKKKAEQVSIEIPDEVLTFLAENLRSNIRQIEGAIKKLSALRFISGQSITMELAKSCLSELLGGAEPVNVTVEKIFGAVHAKYNISKAELVGKKRTKEIAAARHIAVFLIREITDMSYPSIAKIFDRDYATIHASFEQMDRKYTSDSMFKIEIDSLMKDVTG
ncbi:MAG: chromosomal replication initiator protein DnaA [Ruminococcaceae bacterium]|nr:chromosomal replication initiator protein DnaA [Oscillospiraceae bacterium]